MNQIMLGDVLVQKDGQPWKFLVWLCTGQSFPHAKIVHKIYRTGYLGCYEAIWKGIADTFMTPEDFAENYEVWRPRCSAPIKQAALAWVEAHLGQGYGWGTAFLMMLKHRLGMDFHPGQDDNCGKDGRGMVCSELVAMAFYRSGYDLVPGICDRETMPGDLRNPDRLDRVL